MTKVHHVKLIDSRLSGMGDALRRAYPLWPAETNQAECARLLEEIDQRTGGPSSSDTVNL